MTFAITNAMYVNAKDKPEKNSFFYTIEPVTRATKVHRSWEQVIFVESINASLEYAAIND